MRSRRDRARTFTERARRAQIIECAIEVIAEAGYAQASVSRIAERSGVAKSVVLYHFAGKDELVDAVVTRIFLTGAAAMLPSIDAEPTAGGRLRAYIHSNLAFIDRHRAYALAMLDIWTSYRTPTGQRLDEAAAATEPEGDLARLDPEVIFQEGVASGEFRPLPARSMAIALRQAIDGAVLQISRDPGFDLHAYGADVVVLFELGCRPEPAGDHP
ncbi:MAG TPA: TetR/AcrR family transcriptional regulator [Candidatus Dormibacteraeota bacterium]|nr:TetR/AcrR family transcriptional regulator [Candidatus Dormibacteraeota bacterium]